MTHIHHRSHWLAYSILIISALIFLGAGCPQLQTQVTTTQDVKVADGGDVHTETPVKTGMHIDAVLMKDGKMMLASEEGVVEMTDDMVMENGMKVMMDGTVMMKDGSTIILKDGDSAQVDAQEPETMEETGFMMEIDKMPASVCGKEGDMAAGKTCCAGLEPKAVDHAMEVCMKKGTLLAGSYEPFIPASIAIAGGGEKVVLFFFASWCPSCRTADTNFTGAKAAGQIPAGLHILKVNYDDAAQMKKDYGVTYQHTFVQVDAAGKLIKKWSGSDTVAEVAAQVN